MISAIGILGYKPPCSVLSVSVHLSGGSLPGGGYHPDASYKATSCLLEIETPSRPYRGWKMGSQS